MRDLNELCCYYIAFIRAIGLVHQNNHWLSKGKNFYGNHLLFERLYKSAADDADVVAEKLIGVFGPDALDLQTQAEMLKIILNDFSDGDPIQTSLAIEKKGILFFKRFYDTVKSEGKMTLGLDDMIMSVSSNRETAVYLLQQSLGEGKIETSASLRIKALKSILNRH